MIFLASIIVMLTLSSIARASTTTPSYHEIKLDKEIKERNLEIGREQIIAWNRTATDFPAHMTLFELFTKQVEKTPEALAVFSPDKQLGYRETYLLANKIGHALLTAGVLPNQLVGVLMTKGWEQILGCLGVLACGAAFLPIDPTWPESRIHQVLEIGAVKVLLSQQAILETLGRNGSLDLYRCFAVDHERVWSSYSHDPIPRQQTPTDIAYVIFTSGSTGQPKGVTISHRGVVNTITDINRRFQVAARDRLFALSNLTFDLAIYDIFGPLTAGASVVVPKADQIKEPAYWAKEIAKQPPISIWNTVPMFMQMLVEHLDNLSISEKPSLCETLRVILLSGDWIPLDLPSRIRRYFPASQIISLGGATEGSIWSILYPITALNSSWKSIPYGRPMDNQTMYVLDESFNHCPMGTMGDIYIGGIGVALGYWRDEERSAMNFVINPGTGERLYKTGDLGCWHPEGYMEFMGRKDTQVKISGHRIELSDIEIALSQHPSVKQCVASAHQQQGSCKQLIAYIVPKKDFVESLEERGDVVTDWCEIYEKTYQTNVAASATDPIFDISGWYSSYTRKPIPVEEMQEWVASTTKRILSLKPRRVLEIGCGTGLLLSRIAPHCQVYVATDITSQAINLIEHIKSIHPELAHVITYKRGANDFTNLNTFGFDTIVINSVVQCFPSANYLIRVIEEASRLLISGGHLFIGDIRNLALLKSYHASVQLYQAPDTVTRKEFSQHVQSRLAQEEELLIDPRFFYVLKNRIPRIQNVQIHMRQGRFDNELNKFRFDVFLHIGDNPVSTLMPTFRDWLPDSDSMGILRDQLVAWRSAYSTDEEVRALGLRGIPNARLQKERLALAWLEGNPNVEMVGQLKACRGKAQGIDPEEIYQLANELGLYVETSWDSDNPSQFFNAAFTDVSSGATAPMLVTDSKTDMKTTNWEQYVNSPLLIKARRILVPILKTHCQEKLPLYMVPSVFVLLENLPLSSNGKVDCKALPSPISYRSFVQGHPSTLLEKTLAELWSETLGVSQISLQDNFFDLGGSSLLAVHLMSKINQYFKKNYPIVTLFTHNTLGALSSFLQSENVEVRYSPLLSFNKEGSKIPLFFVHSGRGGAEAYTTFANYFDRDQPVYVVESYNMRNEPPFLSTIEAMATKYLAYIQTVQPQGPYYLGGWSEGGSIAYEMAQLLRKKAQEVRQIYLIDAFSFSDFERENLCAGINNIIDLDPFYQKLPPPYRERAKAADRVQLTALFHYKPASYSGNVMLFRASEPWPFIDQEELQLNWLTRKFLRHVFSKKHNGWNDLIPSLQVYPVPGHHQSIMEGDNAKILAGLVQKHVASELNVHQQKVQVNNSWCCC